MVLQWRFTTEGKEMEGKGKVKFFESSRRKERRGSALKFSTEIPFAPKTIEWDHWQLARMKMRVFGDLQIIWNNLEYGLSLGTKFDYVAQWAL